ncbi:MAG: hypothetical protein KDJ38_12020, partial [Gammaproteobacteria bacterium]|nr:hypothetical protein [Gammaproteobacteria bacterium]
MQFIPIRKVLTAVLLLALGACSNSDNEEDFSEVLTGTGSGGTPSTSAECSSEVRNKWIYDAMHDSYLWYQYTPDLDYTSYSDSSRLLNDLRYSKYDRFSYLTSETDYQNSQQGVVTAFGFNFSRFNERYLFRYIEPGSPMAAAGIKRGDELRKIAGVAVDELSSTELNELLDTSHGPKTQTFTVIDRDSGLEQNHDVTSGEFSVQTVFQHNSTSAAGIKTGYLGFSRFMRTSPEELGAAFSKLKQDGIQELVVDLRYNGGGLIYVASQLGGLIAGEVTRDQTFATLKFNDRYSDNNYTYHFTSTDQSLNLQRVIVLTTGSTCSASEMLINGLAPFIDVVTIGASSCGKPIGMSPDINCANVLFAINFESVNALDEGGYFDGLAPGCAVSDLPETDMWDQNDPL